VTELAGRWKMSEERALELLSGLETTRLVTRRGEFWRASAKACRLRRVLEEIGQA